MGRHEGRTGARLPRRACEPPLSPVRLAAPRPFQDGRRAARADPSRRRWYAPPHFRCAPLSERGGGGTAQLQELKNNISKLL
ncbi:hypothetical protein NDU88_008863 [Pleurodeles waltl]|uniref:Uncharacterized protein n=1 Tax=Pleurodeles waltl TaxID=8319 RepID=A0AAV7NZ64_PLEWA|nr:hypothetical protein NDU88_008863 [Pleurodeles waltl]